MIFLSERMMFLVFIKSVIFFGLIFGTAILIFFSNDRYFFFADLDLV